jgi:CubicO group peptidase (beta-lactamase class C family)
VAVARSLLDELDRDAAASDASATLLLKNGVVVWSYLSAGSDREELFHTASVTKFVLGRCVARALHLGELGSLDAPAGTWIREWSGDERSEITLRQLMTHTSGLAVAWPQPVGTTVTATALALEPVSAPGTTVAYNNHGAQLVAEIVRRATGAPVDEYAAANLFGPLGIHEWAWNRDTDDLPFGMSALQLRAGDLARIGVLSLNCGVWNGLRLFSEGWGSEDRVTGRAFGLFEMLVPEVEVLVDLNEAHDIDADLLDSLKGIADEQVPLNGAGSLLGAISRRLGPAKVPNAWASLRRGAPNLRFSRPQLQAYGHDGSGGQHLWIIPKAGAVAVRLRRFDEHSDTPATSTAFMDLALEAVLPGLTRAGSPPSQ